LNKNPHFQPENFAVPIRYFRMGINQFPSSISGWAETVNQGLLRAPPNATVSNSALAMDDVK
jgi:hypothetical protein